MMGSQKRAGVGGGGEEEGGKKGGDLEVAELRGSSAAEGEC